MSEVILILVYVVYGLIFTFTTIFSLLLVVVSLVTWGAKKI